MTRIGKLAFSIKWSRTIVEKRKSSHYGKKIASFMKMKKVMAKQMIVNIKRKQTIEEGNCLAEEWLKSTSSSSN